MIPVMERVGLIELIDGIDLTGEGQTSDTEDAVRRVLGVPGVDGLILYRQIGGDTDRLATVVAFGPSQPLKNPAEALGTVLVGKSLEPKRPVPMAFHKEWRYPLKYYVHHIH